MAGNESKRQEHHVRADVGTVVEERGQRYRDRLIEEQKTAE
jgi:hypothetical protein